MKISLHASVLRLIHECINKFALMCVFDKKNMPFFPNICKNIIPYIEADATNNIASEASTSGASISSILESRIITAVNAEKHYGFIAIVMSLQNMGYSSVFETFKIKYEVHLSANGEDEPKVPEIDDKDNDRKIIRWDTMSKDCLSSSCRSPAPLSCALREDPTATDEVMDPLLPSC